MIAKGRGADIEFDGDYVTIRRHGPFALISVGNLGTKKISIRDIGAIAVREAKGLLIGYIRFSFKGGQEVLGGLATLETDENPVTFRPASNEAMLELRNTIESRIAGLHRTPAQDTLSTADEIAKFAALRDRGIISADEFEAKKKQLLGL